MAAVRRVRAHEARCLTARARRRVARSGGAGRAVDTAADARRPRAGRVAWEAADAGIGITSARAALRGARARRAILRARRIRAAVRWGAVGSDGRIDAGLPGRAWFVAAATVVRVVGRNASAVAAILARATRLAALAAVEPIAAEVHAIGPEVVRRARAAVSTDGARFAAGAAVPVVVCRFDAGLLTALRAARLVRLARCEAIPAGAVVCQESALPIGVAFRDRATRQFRGGAWAIGLDGALDARGVVLLTALHQYPRHAEPQRPRPPHPIKARTATGDGQLELP